MDEGKDKERGIEWNLSLEFGVWSVELGNWVNVLCKSREGEDS